MMTSSELLQHCDDSKYRLLGFFHLLEHQEERKKYVFPFPAKITDSPNYGGHLVAN